MVSMAASPSMTMASKPFVVFKAHLAPPDLPSSSSSSSSSTNCRPILLRRRPDLVFVVNPHGANGSTGKEWKKLSPYLSSRLSHHYNICEVLTSGPSHGIDVTREAIQEGADAVIAVGGDGTLHQVVNGFFCNGQPLSCQDKDAIRTTALGLIPLGTGSDFARSFGWKSNPHEAIDRLAKGVRSWVDVGVITEAGGEPHYFINVADIHLSAKAGYYASRYKRFGNLCYIDGGEWEIYSQVTAICIGNAKYFGGGMKITPNANPSSGSLEVVILEDFKWYDFILQLHRLYNGTHLSIKNVTSRSAHSIEVEEINGAAEIYIQSDGEHLGFLPRKLCILPNVIQMLT
ncbi:hypothetical protein V2J09_016330 [Rumex salicifolius]